MSRAKDAPISTGGQIDPYVQQSLLQGKQIAGNRIIAAMQEAGATQRTAMTTASQAQQTQAQVQMQAAEMEMQDRRAAETMAAQREQNALTKILEESRQRFEAGENTKRLEWEREREAGNDKIAEERHLEMMAEIRASRDLELAQAAMEDNRNFSILTSMQNKETAMEAAITAADQAADEGEQNTTLYQKTLKRQIETATVGFKNIPIKEKEIPVPMTSYEGVIVFPETEKPYTRFAEDYTGPGKVLQKLVTDNGSRVSIGDLTSGTISNLQGQIRDGKIDAEDIRGTIIALDAALPAIDKRIEETSGQQQKLWKAFRNRVDSMQGNLESLRNKKDKIAGQQVETVGSIVRRALGVKYSEKSFSTRMLDLRNTMGQINKEAIQSLTQGIEPWEKMMLPIDPTTMNKYDIATREAHNAGLLNARQKVGGGSASQKWGAE